MPPLGSAWIYLPPRKIPLDFLGAQAGWAAKAGGSSLGRWPERDVAAKSHPKLLTAQTCSWGGARSLRGPGVGARLPQFHSPERRCLAWGPPEQDSRGKAFLAKSFCKGLEVSKREGWRKCFGMKFEFDFVCKHFIFYSVHVCSKTASPSVPSPNLLVPGPRRQLLRLGRHKTSQSQGSGVSQKEGWRLQDPDVVRESGTAHGEVGR